MTAWLERRNITSSPETQPKLSVTAQHTEERVCVFSCGRPVRNALRSRAVEHLRCQQKLPQLPRLVLLQVILLHANTGLPFFLLNSTCEVRSLKEPQWVAAAVLVALPTRKFMCQGRMLMPAASADVLLAVPPSASDRDSCICMRCHAAWPQRLLQEQSHLLCSSKMRALCSMTALRYMPSMRARHSYTAFVKATRTQIWSQRRLQLRLRTMPWVRCCCVLCMTGHAQLGAAMAGASCAWLPGLLCTAAHTKVMPMHPVHCAEAELACSDALNCGATSGRLQGPHPQACQRVQQQVRCQAAERCQPRRDPGCGLRLSAAGARLSCACQWPHWAACRCSA